MVDGKELNIDYTNASHICAELDNVGGPEEELVAEDSPIIDPIPD
jgi:hypothetical protein